jgi:DNA transformation protein
MATSQGTIDYLLDQLAGTGQVSARRMFGEYCLYWAGQPVALVCYDQLFLKPTSAGRALLATVVEGAPFPGARPHLLISADLWEDPDWIGRLVRATAHDLPVAKTPVKRAKKRAAKAAKRAAPAKRAKPQPAKRPARAPGARKPRARPSRPRPSR